MQNPHPQSCADQRNYAIVPSLLRSLPSPIDIARGLVSSRGLVSDHELAGDHGLVSGHESVGGRRLA